MSMTRPSVIQLNPSSSVSGSGSGDNVVDGDDSKSDKPQRSWRSSKASKEDKEFENETKKYLYMAAVEDVKSGKFSSAYTASKFYDVLFHQTINDFVKNGKEWVGGGRKLEKLTVEEEKKITDLLVWRVERGFGYKHHDVALLIQASYLADA